MIYHYFVAYYFTDKDGGFGHGHGHLTLHAPIADYETVMTINMVVNDELIKDPGLKKAIVQNWILLKTERESDDEVS